MCGLVKCIGVLCAVSLVLLFMGAVWVYRGGGRFEAVAPARLMAGEGPSLSAGQRLKVMSWNVQYFAGKNYVFYYDLPGYSGPDTRPSPRDIEATLAEAARVVDDEAPDILLLQEVDDGAARTDGEDQAERLESLLKTRYPFKAEAFYWKARYVPHPKIMGAVGMKLVIFSRYRITASTRIALPRAGGNFFTERLNLQRCLLTAELPVAGGGRLALINLHLEAFPVTPDLLARQLGAVDQAMRVFERQGAPVIAGGDFNLLPPGQYDTLAEDQRTLFNPAGEMTPLFARYTVIPGPSDTDPGGPAPHYTHFPNDPGIQGPDRTLDYLVCSRQFVMESTGVRSRDTLHISDHLPVVATLTVPEL
ncbi:endonuclease/exonuclease/phosphatase family protein [Desulfoluna spongiiphila]|uniref:Metal-dependent hydrolase, endonuclease/exonuclease/phosphatase family n=1 Tax=Desulfoluna spongiiphila TaxID=419481 RepID=A0A1G5J1L0_9BACT|nr:endonuclease/exonuclease/phosphatase family protein [Desulfoluna spongiiphila]SCY82253.1 Metal-dependent hydrolase, endonuclease/exonuclease/phosphatase family [Desulfoluna spongiiphila]VVS94499.1 endonuclease/exonuclease/phosphatase [Desulfoluna spongiiphila]